MRTGSPDPIALHALPPKPRRGAPCNGCGHCCRAEPCGIAVVLLQIQTGPCPALETENGRTYCGLLRNPATHLGVDPRHAPELATLSVHTAYLLGIGQGCDSDDET